MIRIPGAGCRAPCCSRASVIPALTGLTKAGYGKHRKGVAEVPPADTRPGRRDLAGRHGRPACPHPARRHPARDRTGHSRLWEKTSRTVRSRFREPFQSPTGPFNGTECASCLGRVECPNPQTHPTEGSRITVRRNGLLNCAAYGRCGFNSHSFRFTSIRVSTDARSVRSDLAQNLTDLGGECKWCERLLEEGVRDPDDPVPHHRVVRVPAHVENLQARPSGP